MKRQPMGGERTPASAGYPPRSPDADGPTLPPPTWVDGKPPA